MAAPSPEFPDTLFVAPNGNDSWSGRCADPNPAGTDGPFATLDQAEQVIRAWHHLHPSESKAMTVFVRQGTYCRHNTLSIQAPDSTNDTVSVTWKAYPGETVTLSGSKAVTTLSPLPDSIANAFHLSGQQRQDIRMIRLTDLSLPLPTEWTQRGRPAVELFCDGHRLPLARYPNEGWLTVADVPQSGDSLYNKGLEREKRYDGVPVGRHYGRIRYDDNRPRHWTHPHLILCHGYWTWDWSDSYQTVATIDTIHNEFEFQPPHHHYGYTKGQRYAVLNCLEELDREGEWVYDRPRGLIYLHPPAFFDPPPIHISVLPEPLIHLDRTSGVHLEGIAFENALGQGVLITGGRDNQVAGCRFRYLGDDAVVIEGGIHNGVLSCDISDVSMGGIVLKGGDRTTLTPGNHFAVNNHIHHYSQWIRTWQLAVDLYGVGHRVANNLIHDAPHEGIYVRGNDHILEYNEIHRVCRETGDAGAVHTGRDYTWQGNIYRYNYIHHLQGEGLHGVTALYLDDFSTGYTLYGNICYKAGRGTLIGGGRSNRVENNIYIDCHPSILLDARGLGWASNYFDGRYPVLRQRWEAMDAAHPPYSERYPGLAEIWQNEPAVPKYNHIHRNISFGGRWMGLYDTYAYDLSLLNITDNCIGDSVILKRLANPPETWDPYYLDLDAKEGYRFYSTDSADIPAILQNNLLIPGNPGIRDPEAGEFYLTPGSAAWSIGFQAIPVGQIGLQPDRFRTP